MSPTRTVHGNVTRVSKAYPRGVFVSPGRGGQVLLQGVGCPSRSWRGRSTGAPRRMKRLLGVRGVRGWGLFQSWSSCPLGGRGRCLRLPTGLVPGALLILGQLWKKHTISLTSLFWSCLSLTLGSMTSFIINVLYWRDGFCRFDFRLGINKIIRTVDIFAGCIINKKLSICSLNFLLIHYVGLFT